MFRYRYKLSALRDPEFCEGLGNPALVHLENALGVFFRNTGVVDGGPVRQNEGVDVLPKPYDGAVRFHTSCWIDQPFSSRRWKIASAKSFHGKERRDDVEVWNGTGSWYAKIHALVSCHPPVDADSSSFLSLALVQWFEDCRPQPTISDIPRLSLSQNFDVVTVDSVLSQQWMLPDRASRFFHRNIFLQELRAAKYGPEEEEEVSASDQDSEDEEEPHLDTDMEDGDESDDAVPLTIGLLNVSDSDGSDDDWVLPALQRPAVVARRRALMREESEDD